MVPRVSALTLVLLVYFILKLKLFNLFHSFLLSSSSLATTSLSLFLSFREYYINGIINEVKPNFTSIIGKLKYSNNMKLNTHISASYVIGGRAMNFKEKPLSSQNLLLINVINKSEWAKWSYLNKALK